MLNRGNYRKWIFEDDGAKMSFEKALFETCERAGWVLHAYCVMGNHFHLALETPEPNLSEGMRLLQSVFSIRFNKYRSEKGHIFQGRFKSIVVEDLDRLAWLCHYIHLNPVRAGICGLEELRTLGFCSYQHLWDKRKRPRSLNFETCLQGAGGLKDTPAGRNRYADYLSWLVEDEPRQKAMLFDRMSKGWAMGSGEFKAALLGDEKSMKACLELGVDDAREMRELVWEKSLLSCAETLGVDLKEADASLKSADWKVAIAGYLKRQFMCRNGWLATKLNMGTEFGVSRYVKEMLDGKRRNASNLYDSLIAKSKDRHFISNSLIAKSKDRHFISNSIP